MKFNLERGLVELIIYVGKWVHKEREVLVKIINWRRSYIL